MWCWPACAWSHVCAVGVRRQVHDPTLVRPWSKYSKGSSRHQRSQPEEYKVEVVKRAGKGGEGKGKGALSEKELKRQQKREKKAAKKAAKAAKKAAKEAKKAKKAKKGAAGKADSGDKATKDGAGEGDDDVRYQVRAGASLACSTHRLSRALRAWCDHVWTTGVPESHAIKAPGRFLGQ